MRVRIVALAWLLCCCAGSSPPASSPQPISKPRAAAPFTFAWAPPCRIPVREASEKEGNRVTMSYWIEALPRQSEIGVRIVDLEILSVNGQDTTGPAFKEQMRPLKAVLGAMPTFVVSQKGEYLRIEGLEEMIDKMDSIEPNAKKVLNTPELRTMLEQKMGEYWTNWVGKWIDWPVEPGLTLEEDTEIQTVGGALPVHVVHEHRGGSDAGVHLKSTQIVQGPEFLKLIGGVLDKVASGVTDDKKAPDPASLFKTARKTITLEAEIDPHGLRPSRTRFEELIELTTQDDQSKTRRTVRDLTWDWKRAKGCGS